MATFDLLLKQAPVVQNVKRGFSWPAFFFGPYWAISKQMWPLMVGLFLVFGVATVVERWHPWPGSVTTLVSITIWFLPSVYVGARANDWYRNKLLAEGYTVHSSGSEWANREKLMKLAAGAE